jgi:hypothetical protein
MTPLFLALLAWLTGQQNPPPEGLRPEVPACAPKVVIWMPRSFEAQPKMRDVYIRKPNERSADHVALQVTAANTLPAAVPGAPLREDLVAKTPTLEVTRFEGTVAAWKGRPVSMALYEGRFRGQNVFGRMAWLPLDPGTVILNVWGEAISETAINQDWETILAGVSGPGREIPLRERAPGRWWLAKIGGSSDSC